jgi:hypothetical protein
MKTLLQRNGRSVVLKSFTLFLVALGAFGLSGCEERNADDGVPINTLDLPTDTLLNLACTDVGINGETCVLEDPENPFMNVAIIEYDVNNPGAENKFELFNQIPAGPTGAKARFYFWATALARRQSGENQYYTALALHELYDLNSDMIVKEQALKAYRSVLDNFFGSVTVFTCCPGVSPDGVPVPFPVGLNELTAELVLSLLLDWGYTYLPANPPDFNDGVVGVISG